MNSNYQNSYTNQEKLNPAALLPTRLRVLHYLLSKFPHAKAIYVSHTTIAKHLNVDRQTILRTMKWLHWNGYIEKTRREFNTCLYVVTDEAKAERYRIVHLWNQLKWLAPLSLSLILPITKPGVTPYSSKVINNYIYITSARARDDSYSPSNKEQDMKQDRNAWKRQYSSTILQKMDADKQRKHREWLERRAALEEQAILQGLSEIQPVPKIVDASHPPRHELPNIQSEVIHSVTKRHPLIESPVDDDSVWEEIF
jgi:DNA-binding MarR family transcriptional regulator